VTPSWSPDRPVRHTVLALGAAGAALVGAGALLDQVLVLGLGVWSGIAAIVIELVYRP
jgi:hypothetical protein